eukprot:TRINITY_DN14190_c0_g1_i2.p1 TRINITY_DN14190_c0_g1~~TRINITY_DN14190_c0_g1_i2.p1  ORF type:complete len:267 (-),score=53.80 TRINITY_DN14190_c0_g1_i2:49-849(-)
MCIRDRNNREMKNYEKLFFGKLDTLNKAPVRQYESVEKTSVDNTGQLLKTESELIDIGCIDPNKSLYFGNSGSPFKDARTNKKIEDKGNKEFKLDQSSFSKGEGFQSLDKGDELHYFNKMVDRNIAEDSLELKYKQSFDEKLEGKKAVDTLDFLDKIANGPQPSTEKSAREYERPAHSLKESVNTTVLNSFKISEINQRNKKRLQDLDKEVVPEDEMDKLDNLLLNIIQEKKNEYSGKGAGNSLNSRAVDSFQPDLPSLKDRSFHI